jgi:hypothetical protein
MPSTVTAHNVSSRLSKLGGAPQVPKKPSPRIPARPSAPPAHVAAAPKPRQEVTRNVRAANQQQVGAAALSKIAHRAQALPTVDREIDLPDTDTTPSFDLSRLDPGPDRDSVQVGYNCGSCKKFLALNDERRDDPEYMERYLSSNHHCPVAVLEFTRLKGKNIEDVVARANSSACSKFELDPNRARKELNDVLDSVHALSTGEFDILAVSLEGIKKQKTFEDKYDLKLGQRIKTAIAGHEGTFDAIVKGYKGKYVLLEARIGNQTYRLKRAVIEAKVLDED